MKPRVFSGVQPSGNLHIGNYLGAIKNWVVMQDEYDCIFCVVDEHAITVPQDPKQLKEKILEVAAIYLAAGIDPKKSIVFVQSEVPAHTELGWILSTITRVSDLFKMTQFKDKTKQDIQNPYLKAYEYNKEVLESKIISWFLNIQEKKTKHVENLLKDFRKGIEKPLLDAIDYQKNIKYENIHQSVGLLNYPVLMAADILLYHTDVVPVGEDQKQHVEITSDLAKRFNRLYGPTFTIPKALIKKEGKRIMGLDDPSKKMSKSAKSPNNYLALTDTPEIIQEKIKRAVTDSGKEIKFSPEKPAISNLLTIYSLLSSEPMNVLEEKFTNKGYGEFKNSLTDTVIQFLRPFQQKYKELISNKSELTKILADGQEKATLIAEKTLRQVKEKVGLGVH